LERVQAARDAASGAAGEARDAREEVARLTAHVTDLESRKRAPLYQKKQEVGWVCSSTGLV
jgi:hypothetical protein